MHLGRAWWRPAVGVAAAVLLGWGAMWWSASRDGHQALQPAVATTLALRDGSTLAMSAQSRVETREGKSGTEVLLHEGDLLCTVASQGSGRSFEVRTAEARCRVVGTRFQVACLEDGTHVRLDEGTLLVSMLASSAGGERLRPGQGAVISTAGLVTSGGMGLFSYGVDTVDPARWSTGINPGSELSWSIQDSRRWHGSSVVVDYHLRPGSDTSMWAVVNHELPKPREVDPLAMGMEVWFQGGGEGLEAWVEVMEVSAAGHEFFQAVFVDDQAGWRRVRLPWFAFERKQEWQPEGAVDDGFQHQCFSAAGVGIRQWQPTTSHRGRFSFAAVGPYR